MFQASFFPPPILKEFVEKIHIFNIDFATNLNLSNTYTYVPTHTRFLCFYLGDKVKVKTLERNFETCSQSIIIGPQLAPVILDLGMKHDTLIVELKQCGMYRLLGIPLNEILDRHFDASLILGREIDEVIERLTEARDNASKLEVIYRYLINKLSDLQPAQLFDKAMELQILSIGNLSVDYLARQSNLSPRQLERKSLERIGLPPKLYGRMVRFTQAYKLKELAPTTSWNEIAFKCGYFDQMHLIRDFKHFAGFTPNTLKTEDIARSVRLQRYGR